MNEPTNKNEESISMKFVKEFINEDENLKTIYDWARNFEEEVRQTIKEEKTNQ